MTALLQLDRVTKRHWRGAREVVVLDGASLEIDSGELVAIWGRRASGKTTLLHIAAGLEPADSGSVRFGGRDLSGLSRSQLAGLLSAEIGLVHRDGPSIPSLSALDYVALPLLGPCGRTQAHRRAGKALERAGAAECAALSWDSLSDGERALVSIAHAIVRRPKLLLADDPTAGLDIMEREQVLALLESAAVGAGLAVVLTSPDLPDLHAARILSLSHGRLTEPPRDPGAVIDLESKRPRHGELG